MPAECFRGSRIEPEIDRVQSMDSRSGRDGNDRPSSPREVFLRLVNGVCEGPYEDLAGLYAEQTHVTHPFHPLNPPPLRSRSELHEHFIAPPPVARTLNRKRSEEHTSELQSRLHLVCRLL